MFILNPREFHHSPYRTDTHPLSIAFAATDNSPVKSNPISEDYRNALQRVSRNTNDKKRNKRLQIPCTASNPSILAFTSLHRSFLEQNKRKEKKRKGKRRQIRRSQMVSLSLSLFLEKKRRRTIRTARCSTCIYICRAIITVHNVGR